MTYRKKLIEVALPLDVINKASVRENPFVMVIPQLSIYGGHGVLLRHVVLSFFPPSSMILLSGPIYFQQSKSRMPNVHVFLK